MKHALKFLIFCGATLMSPFTAPAAPNPTDITAYDFTLNTLSGQPMKLSQYKGKVVLLVNTASKCGFTPQYKGLEFLYNKYKNQGLVIIGVPSNDFGGQEPGSASEIQQFCQLNYGVTFPMTDKQIVSGKDASPLYQWLRDVLGDGSAPKWNFHKYLLDGEGKPVAYFGSKTAPDSDSLTGEIEKLLAKRTE